MGPVRVPQTAYYGAETQRAVDNFPVSGLRMPQAFIAALAHLKSACAEANRKLNPRRLPPRVSSLIQKACARVADGLLDAEFPVDRFQTGSGTSTHMNVNEVIANLCNEQAGGRRGIYKPVDPHEHVNLGQSSNDVIPSAAHLAALLALRDDLSPALDLLRSGLEKKAKEFDRIVKLGRTHLMDATPVRLGQEFGGYARQIRKASDQIQRASRGLQELALGGTAVGTGINAHPRFGRSVCAVLNRRLGLGVREARNHFEAQASRDDLVQVSGALKGLACALTKIANDVRWMGSGPYGGLAELLLPDLQPGSSIMPGKVNPVMSEMLVQVAAQVIGNDAAITFGGQGGAFELNAMIPLMISNLLQSIALLSRGCRLFALRCVDGLSADATRCAELVERSPISATVLNPLLGYHAVAPLVKEAARKGVRVKDLAVQKGLISRRQADRIFNFRAMTEPGETSGSV